MRALWRRLEHLLRRSRYETELRDEIEAHRALRQEALERAGLSPADAEQASVRALGNVTLALEDARDVWSSGVVDRMRQDVGSAFRGLRKSRVFTLVTIAILALGIGANTALFSILNGLILRPLPVRDPDSLVLLQRGSWTYPIWQEIRRLDGELFNGTFAWSAEVFDLSPAGQTQPIDGAFVSGRMFDVLGVSAARGRMLVDADDRADADAAVAVISHRFWQQGFGGREDAVGRSITIQRVPFTVVGVMPRGFFGPDVGRAADVMIPFAAEPLLRGPESALSSRSTWWLEVMARLRPGQTVEQATAALRSAQPAVRAATLPDWPAFMASRYLDEPFTLVAAAAGKSELRSRFQKPLTMLVVAVGLVLLVACANIAGLFVARTLARRAELSLRLALGASRWRVTRLLLSECALVAAAGAALGLVFGHWSSTLLVRQLNTWRGHVFLDLTIDGRVMAFTVAVTCVSALVAGVLPALAMTGVSPGEAIKDAPRGVIADRRFAVRAALVIAQVAVSLVLVIGAGLFLRTFASLNRVPLGFAPEPLLVVRLRPAAVDPAERRAAIERLREAAAGAPGVTVAALSFLTPITGQGWNNWVGEGPPRPSDRSRMTWINATTPGWFGAMGIPLLRGRGFDAGDRDGSPLVAIVNESFARRFLRAERPVGQVVRLNGGDRSTAYEVVGIVGDAVYRNPREGMMPTIYLPIAQREEIWPTVALTVVAAPGARASVRRDVAAALTRVDPSTAFTFHTFDQLVEATVTQERLVALLAAFFGGLALLLAGVGLYGIVAHAVRARRTEFGIRMALGARPGSIVSLVFRRVGVMVLAGVTAGLVCGAWAARFVQAMLFQLDARDPATFAGAAAVLVCIGALAAWLPARRAAHLDPASVLRES